MNRTHFKKTLLFIAAFVFAFQFLAAQSILPAAKKHITYTFQSGDGTNASGLIYMPEQNAYLAGIAGNPEFPIESFSLKGDPINQGSVHADMRGMWYSPKKKQVMINAAGEDGWLAIGAGNVFDGSDWKYVVEGQHQPDFQSCLTLAGKKVYAYVDGNFFTYSTKGKEGKTYPLSGFDNIGDLNTTTVAYTGVDAYPLALFNYANGAVEFFSLTGIHVGSIDLPAEAARPDMFRFAFANRMAWVYDVETRTWTSYRVFGN